MSARRINAPGKPTRLEPLGHDEPVTHPYKLYRYMRVPLEDRLANRRTDVAA